MRIVSVNLSGVNKLQKEIMLFVADWARTVKKPIPHSEIIKNMKQKGVKDFTTINAIHSLLKKGYIRRSIVISNKTFYTMLRSISK